ncbi:hypothetical protein LOC50_02355 [Pseudoalteromonas sp. SCSIO 43095]|uniref:hypothetical protein n=1 Tax=Pseudoalteromonas sp. SCSIO 43095 TaxID=2894202 RepID=UPI00202AEB99|nr:hypothetical protein [Pseudoalteromonas sp. SCSIO 43095]URQ99179.1 hypothetical protein LOC50_02355 [Pseudoalteromonas sp. SCSIO 43095]
MEVFSYIESLSPFIQGILGAAFLTFTLYVGQKTITVLSGKIGKDKVVANTFALMATTTEYESLRTESYFICLYGASHYFLKSLIFIVLSLLISPINHITSIIGYITAVYFLFRALSYVPHFTSLGKDEAERKEKLDILLKKHDEK